MIMHYKEYKTKTTIMAKYDKKSQGKVKHKMHELKEGSLKSSSGKKVKNRKQAIAIGLSEVRRKRAKVSNKKSNSTSKRSNKVGKSKRLSSSKKSLSR